MILYEYCYEREGNDAWLKDYVQLHSNDFGLYLEHKKLWVGWGDDIKENYTLELDENDLDKSQKILDEYIDEHSLYEKYANGEEYGVIIKLKELIN